MSLKKNEITEDFKRKLTGFLPDLSKNNHYIAFLHDRITCELQIQLKGIQDHDVMNMENEAEPNLVNHPFPLSDERIQFLPMFTDAKDPVYKTDMDELLNWASKKRDPVTFFEMTKAYYSQKKSWVVQKILSLSEDFIKKIDEISNETGIPLLSLHNMYVLMTGVNDFFQSEQKEVLLRPFLQYPVPVSVSPDQRDDLIIGVWNRIYDLLVECYWVVIVVGMVDFLNIVGNYKEEGLEEAQNYLMHSVIYSELESRVLLIKNAQDLRFYLRNEFFFFESFFSDFGQFVQESVVPIVKKRKKVLGFPIAPLEEVKNRIKWEREPSYGSEDEVIDELDRKSSMASEYPGFNDESLSQSDSRDSDDPAEKDVSTSQQVLEKSIRKIPILEEFTVIDGVEQKMEDIGLLRTYHLTGNPDKIIHYLFKLISNVSRSITDQSYSQELDKRFNISSSTWRRWRRKIKKGEIRIPDHSDRPSGVRSINDLFEAEIRKIIKDNEIRKEHQREGYLTQNKLIKMLRSDKLLSALKGKAAILLKKRSRTSLRNMLNKLIAENRIPFEKEGGVNRFKESDFLQIAREIANLPVK